MDALSTGNLALLIMFAALALMVVSNHVFTYLKQRSHDRVKVAHAKVREKELEVAMRKSELEEPKTL